TFVFCDKLFGNNIEHSISGCGHYERTMPPARITRTIFVCDILPSIIIVIIDGPITHHNVISSHHAGRELAVPAVVECGRKPKVVSPAPHVGRKAVGHSPQDGFYSSVVRRSQ